MAPTEPDRPMLASETPTVWVNRRTGRKYQANHTPGVLALWPVGQPISQLETFRWPADAAKVGKRFKLLTPNGDERSS